MKRKWIDLFLFYATVMIIVSGIVLYIMPHGRVAYFTGWKFLGIDKDGWDNLHVIFGFLMVIAVLWHILLNWKVMKKYLLQKESFFALIAVVFISAGTLMNIQPFKSVGDLEEKIKNSWEVNQKTIPLSHAELMSLKDFCTKLDININYAIRELKKRNYKFNINETLKTIAKNNKVTPADIYEIIKNKKTVFMYGGGYGRKTLKEVCSQLNIPVDKCINILNKNNIKAKPSETLREIAFPNNMTPMDIIDILKNNL